MRWQRQHARKKSARQKWRTTNDYSSAVLLVVVKRIQTLAYDHWKCEKDHRLSSTSRCDKISEKHSIWQLYIALHFVWICTFAMMQGWVCDVGWAAMSKNMLHAIPILPIYLNLTIQSYPICLSTQFSKCQFQISQAKLSSPTTTTAMSSVTTMLILLLHTHTLPHSFCIRHTIISTHSHK